MDTNIIIKYSNIFFFSKFLTLSKLIKKANNHQQYIFKILEVHYKIKNKVKKLGSLYSLVVEHLPSKQEVAGSIPATGSFFIKYFF